MTFLEELIFLDWSRNFFLSCNPKFHYYVKKNIASY